MRVTYISRVYDNLFFFSKPQSVRAIFCTAGLIFTHRRARRYPPKFFAIGDIRFGKFSVKLTVDCTFGLISICRRACRQPPKVFAASDIRSGEFPVKPRVDRYTWINIYLQESKSLANKSFCNWRYSIRGISSQTHR